MRTKHAVALGATLALWLITILFYVMVGKTSRDGFLHIAVLNFISTWVIWFPPEGAARNRKAGCKGTPAA